MELSPFRKISDNDVISCEYDVAKCKSPLRRIIGPLAEYVLGAKGRRVEDIS